MLDADAIVTVEPAAHLLRVVVQSPVADHHSWLFDWQALVAGLLALIPALLIYFQLREQRVQNGLLRDQIAAERRRATHDQDARLRAARVAFPAVLSEIIDHAQRVALQLQAFWPPAYLMYEPDAAEAITRKYTDQAMQGSIPTFPATLVQPLQMIVEYSSDEGINQRIASIFREAQVLDARTRPFIVGTRRNMEALAELIIEALALYARAASLFDFARSHSETVSEKPLWDFVFEAMDTLDIRPSLVAERARRERNDGLQPGEGEQRSL